MSQAKVEDQVKIEQKPGSRRKLIQKVRRKVKRQNDRVATAYTNLAKQARSGLGSYLNNNPLAENDFDMTNQITMGQNRKLKKRLKKLQKKITNPDKVFREMQKFKKTLYQIHIKKIFNPVNELEKRRQKRMNNMEKNSKKRKAEIMQKNLQRFE